MIYGSVNGVVFHKGRFQASHDSVSVEDSRTRYEIFKLSNPSLFQPVDEVCAVLVGHVSIVL